MDRSRPLETVPFSYSNSRNFQVYHLWTIVQDIIGPAKNWPPRFRRLFWTRNINHFQRLLFCSFCFVNGLHPDIAVQWADLMYLCRDVPARRHIVNLFAYFESGRYSQRYYSFNVAHGRWFFLDGTLRHLPRTR